MSVLQAVWWSLVGVSAAEAFIQLGRMRSPDDHNNRIVWTRQIMKADLCALGLRAIIGVAVAAVATASGQICSPSTAALAGLAGPLLLTKMFEAIGHLVPVAPVDPTAIGYGHASPVERATPAPLLEALELKAEDGQRTSSNEPEKASDGGR